MISPPILAYYDVNAPVTLGKDIPIPDILSRDVKNNPTDDEEEFEVHIVLQMSKRSANELRQHVETDYELQQLKTVVTMGWPENRDTVDPVVRKYWCFRDELSVYEGLVFKAHQVVVPRSLRKKMLVAIHSGHPGLHSGVRRAKQVLFWINMAADIQEMVDSCAVCQKHTRSNVKHTIVSKEVPSLPFERVATDLFYMKGKEYIMMVDSYSGFFDFKELSNTSSRAVVEQLKEWFAVHGVPRVLESDNGPQYSSEEFKKFASEWCFDHCTSSPMFPRANGLAERFVQTAKGILKKCGEDKSDVKLALLHARNTPRTSELAAPSERLMGRLLRSNLPVTEKRLVPKLVTGVTEALLEERKHQKQYADKGAVESKEYDKGESVLLQYHSDKTWQPARVVSCSDGIRSYIVSDGERTLRRNSHHLRPVKALDNADHQQNQDAVQPAPGDEEVQRAVMSEANLRAEPSPSAPQPRTSRVGREGSALTTPSTTNVHPRGDKFGVPVEWLE
ncbi:uncharacterized protein K02A2.6-like [Armigeres subalbatus]|uniref:uncharacterized protein K02A2.6-like n=1 Tax=Armigeres subalbatus TaxID=124917 RepID=UPI002ED08874